jgi:NADPH:quinone reductase-like Zn-dependent oxidoreductase
MSAQIEVADREHRRRLTMRQIWITKAGPPEVLQVREAPDPQVVAGSVRIRVRAAGINFADLLARVGLYPDAPKLPCVVGYEVAGIVDQVGTGVAGVAEGDRVMGMPRFGGYSDTIVVPSAQVLRMPTSMSFEEGAALPVAYLTAHHMMFYTGSLWPKSRVLIHSAAGGVGIAAIQLAKTRECVILGTASPSKHDFLRAQGCHHPIDSRTDFVPAVKAAVGERGLDLILDAVGAASWKTGYELLAPCGRLVAFGLSAASSGKTRNVLHALGQVLRVKRWSPMTLMNDNKTIAGVNIGHLFDRLDILGPQLQALIAMYEAGQIKPRVDRTFRFEEAAAAHHHIHDRKATGKVVLVP